MPCQTCSCAIVLLSTQQKQLAEFGFDCGAVYAVGTYRHCCAVTGLVESKPLLTPAQVLQDVVYMT